MDSDDHRRRPVQTPGYSQQNLHQQQNSNGGRSTAQQPPIMQAAAPPVHFHASQAGYGHNYGYHDGARANEQALQQPSFSDQTIDFNRNSAIPRSPQSHYYQQGVQNMVYTIPQNSNYQYQQWYGSVSPQQQRHFRPSSSSDHGVAQQTFFPNAAVSSVSTPTLSISNAATAPQGSQYYSPVSQQDMTNSYNNFQRTNAGANEEGTHATNMDTSQPPDSPTARRTAAFAKFNEMLRQTLESMQDDRLKEAAQGLRSMSVELLGNVQRLGLVFDDLSQREFRLNLWNNFNHAWLAVLSRQKDVSEAELLDGTKLAPPKSRISNVTLQTMGDQILNLCNDIDEWGLVDYQMGVWEEQIIDLLDTCLEIALKLDKRDKGKTATAAEAAAATPTTTTNTKAASTTTKPSKQTNQHTNSVPGTVNHGPKSPGAGNKRRRS